MFTYRIGPMPLRSRVSIPELNRARLARSAGSSWTFRVSRAAKAQRGVEWFHEWAFPDGRRWLFPRGDCVLLPVSNTTAELLAQYLGQRLLAALEQRLKFRPQHIKMDVDENHGQWGIWEGP